MEQLTLIGFDARRNSGSLVEKTYFCFHLLEEGLTPETEKALQALGAECLMEAGSRQAYGIAPDEASFIEDAENLEGIAMVERREPPSGK